MFDPNFDPYLELQQCKTEVVRQRGLINKLIYAHNQHDVALLEITEQFKQMIELVKQSKFQVNLLRDELNQLRNEYGSQSKISQPTTDH